VNLITVPAAKPCRISKGVRDLTGIRSLGNDAEQQQRQKAVIELTSGKPSFDVIPYQLPCPGNVSFEKGGWLADLRGFIKDPGLDRSLGSS